MRKLLLVEDDASLGETLRDRLIKEGYAVAWARSLSEAEAEFKTPVDLVILDLGLPDGSGFEFAEKIWKASFTPFLFLTAQAGAQNRLRGFELGAEEFIPKPFHLKELLLRVNRVLERNPQLESIRIAGVTIDFQSMRISQQDGSEEVLPFKEFKLLRFLINSSPRVVSREEILKAVGGEEGIASSRSVDNRVVRLRQALGEEVGRSIQSVRGVGYRWITSNNPL